MKIFSRIFILFIVLSHVIYSQKKWDNSTLDKLDAFYQKTLVEWDVPGISIAIVKDGEIVFSKGYGVKEEGKSEIVDDNTLYAIASNSKAFTSAIIATLVQEGKLDWDDKVQTYLPNFEIYDPTISSMVTIRDILSHRVGLGTFSGDVIWPQSNLTAEEVLRRIKYLPKKYEFRSGYGYSNVMYIAAGEIIKQITGKSWWENVNERFLHPLKMDRTIISPDYLTEKGNFATPHALVNDKNTPIAWVDWEEVAALGGLISSVNDISKWMIFNLNHGILGEDTILTKESRNMMWTPNNNFIVDHTKGNDFNRHFSSYGLGWELSDYHGRLRVSHGGGYDGMISAINLIPDENLGVVVLTNGLRSPASYIAYQTLDAFLGVEDSDWSKIGLERYLNKKNEDTRIEDIKNKRIFDTKPSLPLEQYTGEYHSDIYGKIIVSIENDILNLDFEHTPDYSAKLEHWHYDVWKINWDKLQAWFSFGTIKFNMNNNMEIIGIDFDVPNNDVWFDELKAKKNNK